MKRAILVVFGLSLLSMQLLAAEFLTNDTGETAHGLRVVFSEPVTITGFGDVFQLVDPAGESTEFTFSDGAIESWGMHWLKWEPAGAKLLSSEWLPEGLKLSFSSEFLANDTDEDAYGLRVVFAEPVTITGFGDVFRQVEPAEESTEFTFYGGTLDPWETQWLKWEPVGAKLLSSEWLPEGPRPPFSSAPFPYWGFTLQALSQAGFNDPELYESLDRLIATGANSVLLSLQVFTPTYHSNYMDPLNRRYSQRSEDIKEAVAYLTSAGLEVEMKPSILPSDGVWSAKLAPDNPELWFQNYKAVLLDHAELAEETGITAFYLTNEMRSMVVNPDYTEYWRDIIASIREVYSGQLSINAVINSVGNEPMEAREVMSIPFADELDFIGVSVYLPLTRRQNPSVTQLEQAWYGTCEGVDIVEELREIHALYGKPVMISEIGYRSVDGVNTRPWDLSSAGVVDYQEQTDLFEAMLRVLTQESVSSSDVWFRGVSIWAWFPCLYPAVSVGGPLFGETGESIQWKPAEDLLTHWFHRLGGEEPPDIEYPDLTGE